MRNEKKMIKAVEEIYIQLYEEANPPADIELISKSGEGLKPNWFMMYYLHEDRQIAIVADICKKYKLTKRETSKVSECVCLGYAPNSCYETWLEIREGIQTDSEETD